MNIGELRWFLSGGGTNTDPDLSLGGGISTTSIVSQSLDSSVSGVTVVDSLGCALGAGTLAFTLSTTSLSWTANGDSAGSAVDVSVDGRYVLASGTQGYLVVDVVAASLPGSDSTVNPVVSDVANAIFDDIAPVEAVLGDTEYRCIYLKNVSSAGTATDCRVWLSQNAVGADSVEIGLGSAGLSTQEQSVADESTAPSSITFSAPADYSAGVQLGTLATGDYYAVWIKRSLPANTTTATGNDYFSLSFGAELS